jgi:hypothetical protein
MSTTMLTVVVTMNRALFSNALPFALAGSGALIDGSLDSLENDILKGIVIVKLKEYQGNKKARDR